MRCHCTKSFTYKEHWQQARRCPQNRRMYIYTPAILPYVLLYCCLCINHNNMPHPDSCGMCLCVCAWVCSWLPRPTGEAAAGFDLFPVQSDVDGPTAELNVVKLLNRRFRNGRVGVRHQPVCGIPTPFLVLLPHHAGVRVVSYQQYSSSITCQ